MKQPERATMEAKMNKLILAFAFLALLLLPLAFAAYDNVKPSISISQPKDGSTTAVNYVYVKGTVQDSGGIAQVTIKREGSSSGDVIRPGGFVTQLSFTSKVYLVKGKNVIVVTAYDKTNNKGIATRTVIYI